MKLYVVRADGGPFTPRIYLGLRTCTSHDAPDFKPKTTLVPFFESEQRLALRMSKAVARFVAKSLPGFSPTVVRLVPKKRAK